MSDRLDGVACETARRFHTAFFGGNPFFLTCWRVTRLRPLSPFSDRMGIPRSCHSKNEYLTVSAPMDTRR